MSIATGLAVGRQALPALAADAVRQAMGKADLAVASSVLLYLTADFADDPEPALIAALGAAGCTPILGCTAAGIFTEQDWVLDAPAAAAMVFGDGVRLAPPASDGALLTLAAPSAINTAWLGTPTPRFGGVSGDATGRGPFKVWGSRHAIEGRCEARLAGCRGAFDVSTGVQPLSQPQPVAECDGYVLHALGRQRAADALARHLPLELRHPEVPLHGLMAGITHGEATGTEASPPFRLAPLLAVDPDAGSVTLATRVAPGDQLFWAQRQPLAAERDTHGALDRLARDLGDAPDFGLAFSCLGRGPAFFGGTDRDLAVIRQRFPLLPLIGFYGNGQLAAIDGVNRLLHHALVIGMFTCHV